MAQFCSSCGAAMPDGAVVCPACGKGSGAAAPVAGTTGGMTENVAGLLAYVTIIPAIIFLVLEPYNKNRFIRFHSFQCIFLCVTGFVLGIVFAIIANIPFLGWVVAALLGPLLGLACFILWIVLMLKAYGGQKFKLPVIGDMAEKQADIV